LHLSALGAVRLGLRSGFSELGNQLVFHRAGVCQRPFMLGVENA